MDIFCTRYTFFSLNFGSTPTSLPKINILTLRLNINQHNMVNACCVLFSAYPYIIICSPQVFVSCVVLLKGLLEIKRLSYHLKLVWVHQHDFWWGSLLLIALASCVVFCLVCVRSVSCARCCLCS